MNHKEHEMSVIFYPHQDELASSTMEQKLEVLMESAERYKAVVLEMTKAPELTESSEKKRMTPREITHAFNWEELAKLLRQIRELPDSTAATKLVKAQRIKKLADVYEVLRGAKMPKLETIRLSLMNELKQLGVAL